MKRIAIGIGALALLGVVGCVGDPGAEGLFDEDAGDEGALAAGTWADAPAGCEDVDPEGLRLVAVDEPGLGALITAEGDVRCVDSLSLLRVEVVRVEAMSPAAADPSPQPSHPGMEARDVAGAVRAALLPGVGRADPTPTPMVRADPTPTPMGQADPTPTPMGQPAQGQP